MKKLILIGIVSLGFATTNAQTVCVPTAKTAPGKAYLLPDSATNIVHACAGRPYDETLYIKAFKDTSILGITAVTDSFTINLENAVIGLPSYITISAVPAVRGPNSIHNYKHICIKGDSLACVRLMGTVPTGTPSGTTALSIPFSIKAKIFGFLDTSFSTTYDNYDFVVDGPGSSACVLGVNGIYKNISSITALPNPATSILNVNINSTSAEPITLTILNALGQVVFTKSTKSIIGANNFNIDVAPFVNGIYTLNIQGTEGSIVKKFSKQ
jgi:Secretion system C-terminal sorting domain